MPTQPDWKDVYEALLQEHVALKREMKDLAPTAPERAEFPRIIAVEVFYVENGVLNLMERTIKWPFTADPTPEQALVLFVLPGGCEVAGLYSIQEEASFSWDCPDCTSKEYSWSDDVEYGRITCEHCSAVTEIADLEVT